MDKQYESFDRALKYYNGEMKLSELYLKDLSAPIINGKRCKKLYRIKKFILARIDYLDEDMVNNLNLGEFMKRQRRR